MTTEIERLLLAIGEHPDKLHSDDTPAVRELVALGVAAIEPTLALMLSDDQSARLRAQRVLEGVTMACHGFEPGHGWSQPGEEAFRVFWRSLGDLRWDGPEDARVAALARWRDWLSSGHAPCAAPGDARPHAR